MHLGFKKLLSWSILLISSTGTVFAANSPDGSRPAVNANLKKQTPQADEDEAIQAKIAQQDLLRKTSNDFSFKLFGKVARAKELQAQGNLLLSPFSAYIDLCMALNGTAGVTRDDMSNVLGINCPIDVANDRNRYNLFWLNSQSSVRMEIANAVYCDNDTPIRKEFMDVCQQSYSAEAHNESFRDPATVEKINSWCSSKTHGKINSVLDSFSPDEKLVLLNVVYFKGKWALPFEKSCTQDDLFTTESERKVPIKMMFQSHRFPNYRGTNFESVALEYEGSNEYEGSKQRLYIFLPDRGVKLTEFESQLTQTNWNKWVTSYKTRLVDLSLPRFKIESCVELTPMLIEMGMQKAFDPNDANFTKLVEAPQRAWISRVLQKTYMSIDEVGTEAAAVTDKSEATSYSYSPRPQR